MVRNSRTAHQDREVNDQLKAQPANRSSKRNTEKIPRLRIKDQIKQISKNQPGHEALAMEAK